MEENNFHHLQLMIGGRVYYIKTDEDPQGVEDMARMLDEEIKNVSGLRGVNSDLEATVLASLLVMQKYQKMEADYKSLVELAKKMELGQKGKQQEGR